MGLFDSIFRPNKEQQKAVRSEFFKTLTGYQPVFHTWQGSIYESELIRSAIYAKARHISKLKFDSTGAAKIGLQSKLKQGPNQWQTWPQFLARTSTILDIHNTAFVVPVKDKSLATTGYYTVLPTKCEVVEYKDDVWLRYKFHHDEIAAVRLNECVILTQHQYKKDFFGETNFALEPTVKMIDLNKQGIEEAIKNGATFRFWAKANNFAFDDDLKKEANRFGTLAFSGDNDGMLLFPNTYSDIHQYENKPYTVDADQLKQIQANVYNYFGVNEDVLQNKAKAEELEGFFDGCIEPFAIQFSEALTKMLFSERERAQGSHLIANANRLQYMSTSQKVAMAQQLLDRGVMSVNEARELFNYSPVENGDVRFIRGEYKDADAEVTEMDAEDNDE